MSGKLRFAGGGMLFGHPDFGTERDPGFVAAPPEPGDEVRITAGRHRGSTGILNSLVTQKTPSGESVVIAWVKRPRAGLTPVFSHEIERFT